MNLGLLALLSVTKLRAANGKVQNCRSFLDLPSNAALSVPRRVRYNRLPGSLRRGPLRGKRWADHSLPHLPPRDPPEERLDLWKEIAAYLDRDVTTVQRWGKTGGDACSTSPPREGRLSLCLPVGVGDAGREAGGLPRLRKSRPSPSSPNPLYPPR